MAFNDLDPAVQAQLLAIGNAAADMIEHTETPADGRPEDDPNFSPELEISRLLNRRKTELAFIDGRIADMVLLMHRRGQSWETIGRLLGITGEATRLRYAKLERA
ncbi:hypothetical protein KIH79_11590 [Bifidobacterium sp. 82T10]|uniref:Uncharacterized protein n=1 Tax=Bifidobacterium miconis TaxID=2834435 RepID=A0ABS6WIH2_9BIFI|nr:hypothetical protein [Bifidobacterium miconis]MBW3093550.1 hypothetical protein [Bifidobacterium miconis]